MKWNREEVQRLLSARISDQTLESGTSLAFVHFEDRLMCYELWISEDGVFLSANPETAIAALPFFEIGLPGTELAPVVRRGMPTGIGLYAGHVSPSTLRFSITRRDDGCISLSGAWSGLCAAHLPEANG